MSKYLSEEEIWGSTRETDERGFWRVSSLEGSLELTELPQLQLRKRHKSETGWHSAQPNAKKCRLCDWVAIIKRLCIKTVNYVQHFDCSAVVPVWCNCWCYQRYSDMHHNQSEWNISRNLKTVSLIVHKPRIGILSKTLEDTPRFGSWDWYLWIIYGRSSNLSNTGGFKTGRLQSKFILLLLSRCAQCAAH